MIPTQVEILPTKASRKDIVLGHPDPLEQVISPSGKERRKKFDTAPRGKQAKNTARPISKIQLKNILFLTDFSESSEAALPFAAAIARGYSSRIFTLHVLIPSPYAYATPAMTADAIETEEENVKAAMQKVESQLVGLPHETLIERGLRVWPPVQEAIKDYRIDLIVLGTHGRTGANKLLLGSVAEEIFRRSPVPVLTIGPEIRGGAHAAGHFHRVLFATDFTGVSRAAAAYAVSLTRENQAHLLLLHAMRHPEKRTVKEEKRFELTVAEAIHQLYDTVPKDVELPFPAEVLVEYGEPAERIVESAKQRGADLIILGVRDAAGHIGAATHLERATAHKVVAHAACPVLTVRQ